MAAANFAVLGLIGAAMIVVPLLLTLSRRTVAQSSGT